MNTRMIVALLLGGILLTVAYAFGQAPGGAPVMPGRMGMHEGPMGMAGPMMRRMISERVDQALDRASVSPEQRVAIYASRDHVFAAMDAQRPDPLARRDRMLALFESPQLTQTQLDTLHQQEDQQRH